MYIFTNHCDQYLYRFITNKMLSTFCEDSLRRFFFITRFYAIVHYSWLLLCQAFLLLYTVFFQFPLSTVSILSLFRVSSPQPAIAQFSLETNCSLCRVPFQEIYPLSFHSVLFNFSIFARESWGAC